MKCYRPGSKYFIPVLQLLIENKFIEALCLFFIVSDFKNNLKIFFKYVHFSKNIYLYTFMFFNYVPTYSATWNELEGHIVNTAHLYRKIFLDQVLWALDFSKLFWDSSCEIFN